MPTEAQVVNEAIIEELDRACLDSVLTIREVCGLYRKDYSTVYEHILKGRLMARRAVVGEGWLVSKRSCDEKWGKPE